MRIIRYSKDSKVGIGVRVGEQTYRTRYSSFLDVLRSEDEVAQELESSIRNENLVTDYKLLPPIEPGGKILCSGFNYASHKDENANAKYPTKPSVFSKLPSSLIAHEDAIVMPYPECHLDYEVELVVVIGKTAKHVSRSDAYEYVYGYTVMNDVSARDLQFELQHETIGKGVDTFCPLGPEIVTKDEIPNPSALYVSAYVNGERRQLASTADLLFDIPTMIEYFTRYITLSPGDIIATGTPAGVGAFFDPPKYMKPGDVVEVEVDAIGKLRNPIVAGWER